MQEDGYQGKPGPNRIEWSTHSRHSPGRLMDRRETGDAPYSALQWERRGESAWDSTDDRQGGDSATLSARKGRCLGHLLPYIPTETGDG